MNSLYKKLSSITIILFLIGIVGVTYYLYQVSTDITRALQIREINQIELVEKAMMPVSVMVGIEILLGISAILFLLLSKQNLSTNVISNELTKDNAYAEAVTTNSSINVDKRVQSIESKFQSTSYDVNTKLEKILSSICNELDACQGAIFQTRQQENKRVLEMCASYAYFMAESKSIQYEFGEGLTGQVAKEGKLLNISTIPDGYVTIISGLGNSSPKHLIIAPIKSENTVIGIIELASFKPFTKSDEDFFEHISSLLVGLLATQSQEEEIA